MEGKLETQNQVIKLEQMEITFRSDICTVYNYEDEAGSLMVAAHQIYPGIRMIYKDFHRSNTLREVEAPPESTFIIEHCHRGRVECRVEDFYFYLTDGDIALRRPTPGKHIIEFPMEHYQGIDIVVDVEKVPKCLSCLLPDVDVEPARLVKKFGLDDRSVYFLRQNRRLAHIFSELYDVPESIRRGYVKVKILEILLFLTGMELEEDSARKLLPKQVRIAKEAHAYLAENMHRQITIAQLAQQFGVSETFLKESFRKVFGTTVQGFIAEQKMREAAWALQMTDRKITEIATEYGYANPSKFSAAFRRVMGVTPQEYRIKGNSVSSWSD